MGKMRILFSYFRTRNNMKMKTKEKLIEFQKKKMEKHFKYLKVNSPFFCNMEIDVNDISNIPLMDKEVMMSNFNELNTKRIIKEEAFEVALEAENTRDFSPLISDVTVGLSSGTSGNRGLFLVSQSESEEWAGAIIAKVIPEGLKRKQRVAFFLRANSNLYESINSKFIDFNFFDLMDNIEKHVQKLNELQPSILIAPPSMMRILAQFTKDGELEVNPDKIITMAEVLDPLDEDFIEDVFSKKIRQVYQCTEGFLGVSCEHGSIHLNEDIVFIEKEFIDEGQNKFYPIITDFTRKTQPIVRYKLNDILTLKKEKCPCGSPFTAIEQIEGRSDDIFCFNSLKNKDEKIMVFPDFIRRSIITSTPNIKEYRVIQHSPEKLEVQIVKENEKLNSEEEVVQMIRNFLESKEVKLPNIEFRPYELKDKGRKMKRVERLNI